MTVLRIAVCVFFFAASIAACAVSSNPYANEDSASAEGASSSLLELKYEGTCEFLRNCSTWSRGLPEHQVMWGCTGAGMCSDTERWVAAPTRAHCGKTVELCTRSGTCTTAKVRDLSVTRDWEAGNGVLDALDLPHGLFSGCSGYGGGNVTVKVVEPEPSEPESRAEGSTGEE